MVVPMKMLLNFWQDKKGATAVLMSIAIIPVIATFTLAVDYSASIQKKGSYQSIADSAALSGATSALDDTDEARKARAKLWFETQVTAQNLISATVTVTVADGTVEVLATAPIKPLVNMINFGDQEISVRAVAMISKDVIHRVLDVAMCIDATGSMQNTINSVKARAQNFSTDLNNALKARNLESFDYTRIRVIFYRDFAVDNGKSVYYRGWGWYQNPHAMAKSDFMVMPDKKTSLEAFIGSESASGGGDLPESGYECINEGMSSNWFTKGAAIPNSAFKADEVYPVIVLWSDADALPIPHQNSINSGQYPSNMPQSETLFRNKWNDSSVIDQKNRLLVHFGLCNKDSWALGRSLIGYMCGGTLSDGNTNMINKIADVMAIRYQNKLTRLSR
jgi:Flp pilus assembly protein TadG